MSRPYQKKTPATKTDKFGYSGILREPIKMGDPTNLDFDLDAEKKRIGKETADRLTALFQHYLAIDPPSQEEAENLALWLAMKLAQKHVKGFDLVPVSSVVGRGKTFKWPLLGTRLVVDVEELMSVGKTEEQACRLLAKKPLYAKFTSGNPASLRVRYHEAKNAGKLMPVLEESLFSKLPEAKQRIIRDDFSDAIRKITDDPAVTSRWRQK